MNEPFQPRRVVITGHSVISALGFRQEEFWARLLAGECSIARLPHLPADSPVPVKIGGCISNDRLTAELEADQIDDPDRGNQLALLAVSRALADAGLPTGGQTPLETDIIFGTGHGNVGFTNEASLVYFNGGYRKMRPTTVLRGMFNRPANLASIRFRLTGANFVVSCACASGSVAVMEAFQRVRFGLSNMAVAACADAGMDIQSFSAWNRLGVLSRIPEPERACRPFDRGRDGFVMGEGGAGFVLETLESARARGARIQAEVLAASCTSDAMHLVQPDVAGQARAVRQALAQAGLTASDVDYINAHGTATDLADVIEATTLRAVFGSHADSVPVSNTKAQLGHLMAATAGVELAATLGVLQHGIIPPCRNLDDPDPRCPLAFVRGEPLRKDVRVALKNTFAFGGTNAALVLARAP